MSIPISAGEDHDRLHCLLDHTHTHIASRNLGKMRRNLTRSKAVVGMKYHNVDFESHEIHCEF